MAPRPRTIAFSIDGPIVRTDLSRLCDRVCDLLAANGADVALCDVRRAAPDAVTVEALARLQLAARRQGCHIRLGHPSTELLELLSFMGLREVLPARGAD